MLRMILLLSILAVCVSQLSTYFSASELKTKQGLAQETLQNDKISSADAYYSSRVLDSTQISGYDCNCKSIIASPQSLLDIYFAKTAYDSCGCSSPKFKAGKIVDDLESKLKSKILSEYVGALLAAKATGAKTPENKSIVTKLIAFMQPADGLFRSKKSDASSASIANTKLALMALSEFGKGEDAINEVAESVSSLLSDGENTRITDPSLLAYLTSLLGKKPPLEKVKGQSNAERMLVMTEGLLANRHLTSSLADTVDSLKAVMSYKSRPVYIALTEDNALPFDVDKNYKLKFVVKDAFGKDIVPTSMVVNSVKKSGRDSKVLADITLDTSKKVLKFDKATSDITPGIYEIEVALSVPDRTKEIVHTVYFTIKNTMDIFDVRAGVSSSKSSSVDDLVIVDSENNWSGEKGSFYQGQYVHVAFTVATPIKTGVRFVKPHQVFVKFSHEESGVTSFFVGASGGTYTPAKGDKYSGFGAKYGTTVSLAGEADTFYHLSGNYIVSILVGDATTDAQEYVVGSVRLEFNTQEEKFYPLYVKSLLHTSDHTLKPLPEIKHRMRDPPKTATLFMSGSFTLFVLVPLVAFIAYALSLKFDLRYMTSMGMLYMVGVTGIVVLYVAYWFTLPGASFYETVMYIVFLMPILLVIGNRAVSSIIAEKAKDVVPSKKKD